jgi:hypothetical protein
MPAILVSATVLSTRLHGSASHQNAIPFRKCLNSLEANMEEQHKQTHKVARRKADRPRPGQATDWFVRLWGPPSRARTAIIGLAILLPIVGVVPVLLFAPAALAMEYFKWASPLVTTGFGYLLGRGQQL